jgi:RNA polymerase sigma-70 factor (ECF subfamily)
VAELKARNSASITTVVRVYSEQLYRASLGLGFDPNSACELVQRVWTTFFEVVGEFQGKSHIRTFIFGILYNKAFELRRERRNLDLTDPVEDILKMRFDASGRWIKPPTDPEEFLMGVQTISTVEKCLETLPLTQRMVFITKEVEEQDSEDICKILDISVTDLGVLLYRAKNRLRECIDRKGKINLRGK